MKHTHSTLVLVTMIALVSLVLSACGPAATPTPAPVATEPPATEVPTEAPVVEPAAAALTVTGLVGTELALTDADLHAMEVVTLTAEHPKNGPGEYTGIRLNALLDLAQVKPEAITLVLVASDGFSAEVELAAVRACADCLVSFGDTPGDYLAVMPGQSSKAWVKGLVSIELK